MPAKKRATSKKNLCQRCERRSIHHGEQFCQRCLVIISRTGEVPKGALTKNQTCLRCKRRAIEPDYLYCERCLVLVERETGEKPKRVSALIIEQKKKNMVLCKRCERRAPEENSKFCARCQVLIERENDANGEE